MTNQEINLFMTHNIPSSKRPSLKQMRTSIHEFMQLCLGTGRLFILTVFSLVITAFATLTVPIMLRYMIDIQLGQDLDTSMFLLFGGLIITLAIGTALRYYSITITAERIYNNLRAKIFAHIINFSHYELQKLYISDILSRLSSDAELIREFIGSSMSIAARNLLLLCGGFIMMLHTGFFLTLITLLIIPIILVPVIIIGRTLKAYALEAQQKLGTASSILNESLYALSMVQNFNRQDHQISQFKQATDGAYEASSKRITKRSLLTFWIIILLFGSVFMVLFYGSYAVRNDLMSVGQFTQFILYTVFTAGAAASLSEVWGSFYKVQAAYQRLNGLLEIKPYLLKHNGTLKPSDFKQIELQNASLTYDNRETPALSDINLTIKAKQKIAFVGESGSGKTSLLKILLRDLNLSSGSVIWNNKQITEYDNTALKQQIAYVSQETILFSGTIEDNIRFGNLNATPNQIIQAASAAQIHKDILQLPEQYKTHIGERGFQMSGGQRQRIAIARCLLKNAHIWILDEPTSALDTETEHKIFKTLSELTHDKTLITVSHRLSILSQMDKIYVLEKGCIIEQGTHQSLWQTENSRYKRFLDYEERG